MRFQTLLWEFLTHFWLLLDPISVESGRMKAVAAVRRKGANNVEVSLSSIPGSTTVRMAPLATATSLSTFMARAQMAANKMFNMQMINVQSLFFFTWFNSASPLSPLLSLLSSHSGSGLAPHFSKDLSRAKKSGKNVGKKWRKTAYTLAFFLTQFLSFEV